MKIALVGTSPIILLLAEKLSEKNDVIIFDNSKKIGGAWSWEKFNGVNIPDKTNVIVPANAKEEKKLEKINHYFLKKFSTKTKKILNSYHTLHSYKPKKLFDYNLFNIYKKILSKKKIKLVRKKIFKLEKKNENIILNNSLIFNKIFIPYFAGINNLICKKKKINFEYNVINSKHILIITKKKIFKDFYYSENFNYFLDRAQLEKKKNIYFFKARIRKEFKLFKKKEILNLLLNKKMQGHILKCKIIKYKNFYRNVDQIKKIKKIQCKNIKIVNTSQFVNSFFKNKISNEKNL